MTPKRGIQFSPRLEVRETWHSAEYDRRGESATCNRLTPQLAQMIKEELNAFKMEEMIVHEVPNPPPRVEHILTFVLGKSILYTLLLRWVYMVWFLLILVGMVFCIGICMDKHLESWFVSCY